MYFDHECFTEGPHRAATSPAPVTPPAAPEVPQVHINPKSKLGRVLAEAVSVGTAAIALVDVFRGAIPAGDQALIATGIAVASAVLHYVADALSAKAPATK